MDCILDIKLINLNQSSSEVERAREERVFFLFDLNMYFSFTPTKPETEGALCCHGNRSECFFFFPAKPFEHLSVLYCLRSYETHTERYSDLRKRLDQLVVLINLEPGPFFLFISNLHLQNLKDFLQQNASHICFAFYSQTIPDTVAKLYLFFLEKKYLIVCVSTLK